MLLPSQQAPEMEAGGAEMEAPRTLSHFSNCPNVKWITLIVITMLESWQQRKRMEESVIRHFLKIKKQKHTTVLH